MLLSGATGSAGYVRDAHQGTLLLDEIVAAPPEVQVALLRVLQEKVVTPVGSTRAVPIDVRFVAAAQRRARERKETRCLTLCARFRVLLVRSRH